MTTRSSSLSDTDIATLRTQIEAISSLRKKRTYSRSRLNRYLQEILLMRFDPEIEASYESIALWLRKHKRIKTTRENVAYFIKKHVDEIDDPIFLELISQ